VREDLAEHRRDIHARKIERSIDLLEPALSDWFYTRAQEFLAKPALASPEMKPPRGFRAGRTGPLAGEGPATAGSGNESPATGG
jgi:hypothetical protein